MTESIRRRVRVAALLALVLVAGVAGCEDPFKITANRNNIDTSFELWALTGSPPAYPSALLVPLASPARLDAAGSFDLAFDINADGRLVVYPASRIVQPIAGNRQIGFQRATSTFSTVFEAPRDGWTSDTALVMNPGQTFMVKVSTLFCQFDFKQDIYAKFYVDSVIPDERRIKLIGLVNPNCGFRSFLSGIPLY